MSRSLDICVCTFRRPDLAALLASLAQIDVPADCRPSVIVIDNDDTETARPVAEAAQLPFPLRYLHAPGRNISIARNAALDAARAEFLVFLDDDETVSTSWLSNLWATAEQDAADIVFGPVVSIYPAKAPDWIKTGDYHSTKPPAADDDLRTGCSANVLMRRAAPALQGLRFDLGLGRSGGEDTVFFRQAYAKGAKLSFARTAIVHEKVDPKRLSLRWLLQRKFRSGQSHALSILSTSGSTAPARLRLAGLAGLKGGYCLARAGLHPFDADRRYQWLIRGALHAGVVTRCLGGREQVLYGQVE